MRSRNHISLTNEDYWDSIYANSKFEIAQEQDLVCKWLEPWFLADERGSKCLEIGCFPGRYLAVAGKHGYQLNGVDFAKRLPGMVKWLRESGYNIGEFHNCDFFSLVPSPSFDLVMSMGFIEHFENFEEVLVWHTRWLKPGGRLLVTTPNFSGWVQQGLRLWLDRKNLSRHHLPAMDLDRWRAALARVGCNIHAMEPFGGFAFWTEEEHRNAVQRLGLRIVFAAESMIRRRGISSHSAYSPFLGISASKQ